MANHPFPFFHIVKTTLLQGCILLKDVIYSLFLALKTYVGISQQPIKLKIQSSVMIDLKSSNEDNHTFRI